MFRRIFIPILSILILSSCQDTLVDSIDENSKESNVDIPEMIEETKTSTEPNGYIFDKDNPDYREAMRQWVMTISKISKSEVPSFIVIPQNCSSLFTDTGDADGQICNEFLNSIDGTGQESIAFGHDGINKPTKSSFKEYITSLLNLGIESDIKVLSVNYCNTTEKAADALEHDKENGYISFISEDPELNKIPDNIINENNSDITSLNHAKNWLFMLNPEKYDSKENYINALCKSNFDVIVIDAFFNDNSMLSIEDVSRLKVKANGGKRLVISYLSIGEAEDYRYYWMDEYFDNQPEWILDENPNWQGNYPVKYWNEEWQGIIATGEDSYLNRIINANFDGVYLDIVDGYQTFENMDE